jgi:hypothetical protein
MSAGAIRGRAALAPRTNGDARNSQQRDFLCGSGREVQATLCWGHLALTLRRHARSRFSAHIFHFSNQYCMMRVRGIFLEQADWSTPVQVSRMALLIVWTLAASAFPVSSQSQNMREFEFLYPADTLCITSTSHLKLQAFDRNKRDASAAMKSPTPYQVAVSEVTVYPLTSTAISNAYVTAYFGGIAQKITSYTDRHRYEDTQEEIRNETKRLANEICQIKRYPGKDAFTAKDPRFNSIFFLFGRAFDILDQR